MRMRGVLFFTLFICALAAHASEPGQPLDCSDWIILDSGYTCTEQIPYPCPVDQDGGTACKNGSSGLEPDNEGRLYYLRSVDLAPGPCNQGGSSRTELVRVTGSLEQVLAFVDDRCNGPASRDRQVKAGSRPIFDDNNGKLYVALALECHDCNFYSP